MFASVGTIFSHVVSRRAFSLANPLFLQSDISLTGQHARNGLRGVKLPSGYGVKLFTKLTAKTVESL